MADTGCNFPLLGGLEGGCHEGEINIEGSVIFHAFISPLLIQFMKSVGSHMEHTINCLFWGIVFVTYSMPLSISNVISRVFMAMKSLRRLMLCYIPFAETWVLFHSTETLHGKY